jgi:hypothetical protein
MRPMLGGPERPQDLPAELRAAEPLPSLFGAAPSRV